MTEKHRTPGQIIATVLRHAWKPTASPLALDAKSLDSVASLLLKSGAGALAWQRIHNTELEKARSASDIHQAYRLHTLQAAVQEVKIEQLITGLKEADIEPLLVKGWAVARLYPEPGLRPYSDVDLIVRDDQYPAALDVVKRLKIPECSVDLHKGISNMGRIETDAVYDRSQLINLGQINVRIPGEEDHLRMLCFHLLRHGAWRPLWLCDIAIAVETRSVAFNWGLCLGGSRREVEWVSCSMGLAERILGADISDTPATGRIRRLPEWLVRAVLRNWDRCSGASQREPLLTALISRIRDPRSFIEEARFRWDRPIEASLDVGAPFNSIPRLPFQLAATLMRVPLMAARLAESLSRRKE